MIRKVSLLSFILLFAFAATAFAQDPTQLALGYNWDTADTLQSGFGSIRAVAYHPDLLGDGVGAIATTSYAYDGLVHVLKVVDENTLELVWTSPLPEEGTGGGSTPRHVVFADLDNDGRAEVIFHRRYAGLMIFEWDGVAGSYNFGTQPSRRITNGTIEHGSSGTEYCEFLEVGDYDRDGFQELVIAYNSSSVATDNYYIISALGGWNTNDPGFSALNVEWTAGRGDPGDYGFGGSPIAMFGVNLDGDGDDDVMITNWNFLNVCPVQTLGPNSFQIADTTNGKAHLFLCNFDKVALMGGFAFDVDDDGREEAYLTTYSGSSGWDNKVHMIHYQAGESIAEIDTLNHFILDATVTGVNEGGTLFGWGYGDYDADGKPNLYFGSNYSHDVITAEFQGGDKTDQGNWTTELVYAGDSTTHYTSLDILYDSTAVADGLDPDSSYSYLTWPFVSNMYARYTDFDQDGYEDMILPYQTIYDSIDVTVETWTDSMYIVQIDTIAGEPPTYDTTFATYYETETYEIINPKRWSLRIIESLTPSSIEARDLKVVTPDDYALYQNYPNPFNPETKIGFFLPINKKVSLTIYDALGQKVKTLVDDQVLKSGKHEYVWDATNQAGQKVATGMYIYTLRYGNFSKSMKMMLVK